LNFSRRPLPGQRSTPLKSDQRAQSSNRIAINSPRLSNDINPPEVVSTRNGMTKSQLRRKKQQHIRAKENRTLVLSGNVDLGKNVFKSQQLRKKKLPKAQVTTETNRISENYQPNHRRHNHYSDNANRFNEQERRRVTQMTTTEYPVTQRQTTSRSLFIQTEPPITPRPASTTTERTHENLSPLQNSGDAAISSITARQIEKV
jgi:hypothetical protein